MRKKYVMNLHVYAKMQRNHSCTSKMRKTPHFGQFSNGTYFFIYANRNKDELREVTKQVVWIILRNRIFHGTIRHIRSGFSSYARTLCALTLPAYALKTFFSQGQIQQLNHALNSKIALIYASSAMAQWVVRLFKCRC